MVSYQCVQAECVFECLSICSFVDLVQVNLQTLQDNVLFQQFRLACSLAPFSKLRKTYKKRAHSLERRPLAPLLHLFPQSSLLSAFYGIMEGG